MSRFALVPALFLAAALAAPVAHAAALRAAEVTGVVNLNTATQAELQLLPGIGPAKAQRILEQRVKHKFDSTDQVMRAKGIGRKMYRKLKPNLAVAGTTTLSRKAKSEQRRAEETPATSASSDPRPPPTAAPPAAAGHPKG